MRKTTFLTVSISVFLLLAMVGAIFVMPVAASLPVHNINTGLDYATIQEAIHANETLDGHTIVVDAGTYYEHLVVNKSLTLVGEASSTTIIDGNGAGIVVRINAPDVEIRGFTVQNGGVSPNSGILLGSCVRNAIRDCTVRNNAFGIELHTSNDCIIVGNVIMNSSWAGIHVIDSSNNEIHSNMIANNSIGVWIPSESSLFNTFYHNNFIDNLNQAQTFAFARWDNDAEGNYWSDYPYEDRYSGPYQNEVGSDGIGDTPYGIYVGNQDKYPLMTPWSPLPIKVFDVVWEDVHYPVATLSNSTITHFIFNQTLAQISFNVSGSPDTVGYCNVTIPKNLLRNNPWTITMDGVPITDFTQSTNDTHTFLYFTYTHAGTSHIVIEGTWVIPEFSWSTSMLMLFVLVVLLVFTRRRSRVFE